MSTFPRVKKSERGYDPEEVEKFLEVARVAYAAEHGSDAELTSTHIRHTAFGLRKGGYSPSHVDAALERLEDAFATRERDEKRRVAGEDAWREELRVAAQEVIARLERPDGERFQRVSLLADGYDRKQVDAFAARLLAYFTEGKSLSVDEVRTVAFRPRRGGYREAQVDLLLDTVIGLMLAIRP